MSPKTNDLVYLVCGKKMKINHKTFHSIFDETLVFALSSNSFFTHFKYNWIDTECIKNDEIEEKYWIDAKKCIQW